MDPLIVFMIGLMIGCVGTIILTLEVVKRAMDKRKNDLTQASTKIESVTSRMKKVKEITNEQLDIQSATSGPQKNAMHGKYKNGLTSRLKELEEQKNAILTSIVVDGFDPEITIMDEDGTVTTTKLSEFLAQNGITIPPKGSQPPPRPVGKFVVHKGGKDDGGTTH